MRNINWTLVILALCAVAALFYLMKQKEGSSEMATATATAMDVDVRVEEGNPHGQEMWMEEENPYGEMEEEWGMKVESSMPAPRR